MQVDREIEKFTQIRAKLDTLDRTLDRYSGEELRQLFQAAKEREVYIATLSAELEGLEYKRSVLADMGRTLARLASLLRGESPADVGDVASYSAGEAAAAPAA